MREKVHTDAVLGDVLLRKAPRSRRISLRVHPVKGVIVSMPPYVPYAVGVAFLESRREWALAALRRASAVDAELPEGESVETLRARAKAELPARLQAFADRYGFHYNRLTIKHNTSNWGSCSTKGNINLNLNLMRVPEPLQDYVMLHELAHLRHPDHGPGFHAELERLLADHFSRHLEEDAFRAYLQPIGASRAKYRITSVLEKALRSYRPL
ncbi:MAG: M48 family metallopeptidase [Bacteroidales bacterium]|nr:M48 family metallopeptidase [Bacteroidales bacterium]